MLRQFSSNGAFNYEMLVTQCAVYVTRPATLQAN